MRRLLVTLLLVFASSVASGVAHAQSIIKTPGDHPNYKVELEPHVALGWGHLYHGSGLGIGGRVSIPIVENGFISTINNSVAIGFGLDWLRYSDCYYYDVRGRDRYGFGCGASYLVFPVVMQWNFWLTPRWSVFGEPGLYVYHGTYDNNYCNNNNFNGCSYPTRTGVDLSFYVGGRFHFNDTIALTLRLGYPTSSIGVSFLF